MQNLDVKSLMKNACELGPEQRGISPMARSLIGSEILAIAGEVRAMLARGEEVLNLTVGDFSSAEFPIPEILSSGIANALRDGHTNYPPPNGTLECREAIREMTRDRLGLDYPIESVLTGSGSRPMIAGTFLTLVGPGDAVVYGTPSWNNNHYCSLVGARRVEIATRARDGFFPNVDDLAPVIRDARLVCLNSPQNPTGTAVGRDALEKVCRLIVAENERRKRAGEAALHLMYDQVYWMLTFGGVVHENPISLVPEIAPYTILVDGISKGFAATGIRVGWALGPADVMTRMAAILTHIGAWAPKPEQVATAALLSDRDAMDRHLSTMTANVFSRLELLNGAVERLRRCGYDVEAIPPQGAIYLSIRFNLFGKTTPTGDVLRTDEDIRKFMLREAKVAMVPFRCFGVSTDTGWFRASVGSLSIAECERVGASLEKAFARLR